MPLCAVAIALRVLRAALSKRMWLEVVVCGAMPVRLFICVVCMDFFCGIFILDSSCCSRRAGFFADKSNGLIGNSLSRRHGTTRTISQHFFRGLRWVVHPIARRRRRRLQKSPLTRLQQRETRLE
jgi:hypothetical protein